MEEVKDLEMTLRIMTNHRNVEERFKSVFDLKTFMDEFFCTLREKRLDSDVQVCISEKPQEKRKKKQIPRRFGVVALEKGFITLDQLAEAQHSQLLDNIKKGRHRPIGGILSKKGLLTMRQIAEVLRCQGKNQSEAFG
jgi:hypothetical protein